MVKATPLKTGPELNWKKKVVSLSFVGTLKEIYKCPPLSMGDMFQDSSGCLGWRRVWNPVCTMFSPIHTYLW